MKPHVFSIKALTNLHVGSGDAGYGPIDKMIQLDPATGYPTIFGQSLKGALREYFAGRYSDGDADTTFIEPVFGSSVKRAAGKDPEQGSFTFLSADLLAMPIPTIHSQGGKAYNLVGSPNQLTAFVAKVNAFDSTLNITEQKIKDALTCDVWNEQQFQEAAKSIPVLARNQLDNGLSENLWYEQFLPHQSVFCTIVFSGNDKETLTFIDGIKDKVIQLGANATVGYGYCQFKTIEP